MPWNVELWSYIITVGFVIVVLIAVLTGDSTNNGTWTAIESPPGTEHVQCHLYHTNSWAFWSRTYSGIYCVQIEE